MSRLEGAGRLLRTVMHLRPEQVWHRLRLRAVRAVSERSGLRVDRRYRERAGALSEPRWKSASIERLAALRLSRTTAAERLRVADDAVEGRFTFLGRTEVFGREVAWHRPDLDRGTRLWKTMLHEFSYAEALAATFRDTGRGVYRERLWELVASWRAENPIGRPGFALDAWNARAVATRMLHWTVAAHLLEVDSKHDVATELARHALFLRDHLEWDLRANHLLRDLLGLVLAREIFGGFDDALDLLRDEIAEQVLSDGGHVERCPLYQAIVLQDLVEARVLLGEAAPSWLDEAVARMARKLRALRHGDGDLPLFGDTWLGEIDVARLLRETGSSEEKATGDASGLVTRNVGAAHLVVRAGPHGPDYQMGHAHGDLLSFELSHGAQRIITDTGTGTYDAGEVRDRTRSTAAHNTVQLDDHEQLEAWSSFRVGRRGRASLVASGERDGIAWLWAEHDAYRFLPGRPVHHRLFALSAHALLVLDAVSGHGGYRVQSRLHLYPEAPARVLPLGGASSQSEVPFYERFGTARPMPELTLEERSELPWMAGWLVLFGAAAEPDPTEELRWQTDALGATVRYESTRLGLEARWEVWRESGPGAVHLSLGGS